MMDAQTVADVLFHADLESHFEDSYNPTACADAVRRNLAERFADALGIDRADRDAFRYRCGIRRDGTGYAPNRRTA